MPDPPNSRRIIRYWLRPHNRRKTRKETLQIGARPVKKQAYRSVARQVLEYACSMWDPLNVQHIKSLEAIQWRGLSLDPAQVLQNLKCEWQLTCWQHRTGQYCDPDAYKPDSLTSASLTMNWSPSTASVLQPSKSQSEDPARPIHSPTLYHTAKQTTGSTHIFQTPWSIGTACLRTWPQPPPSNPSTSSSSDYPLFQTGSPLTKVE